MGATSLLEKARSAKRESKNIEFKDRFNPVSPGEWCEIIKDIVAIANSGGGVILVGVNDNGTLSGADVTAVLSLDNAVVADKLKKYIGDHFDGVAIMDVERDGQQVAAMVIGSVTAPLVFTNPGTYATGERTQKTAFSVGTVYFRHGAKSAPGTTQDLRQFIERQIEGVRKSWMGGIRKVTQAPVGAIVRVYSPGEAPDGLPEALPIRVVDDLAAPGFATIDKDKIYPYRVGTLLEELNKRIDAGRPINTHDILCVRRAYDVDSNEDYYHLPKFAGSPQYSQAFLEWLIQQFNSDAEFFERARHRKADDTKAA